MKGKVLMTVMVGLFFLFFVSSIVEATPGGIPECQNNLSICTTHLTNAQTNLAKCQATVAQCIQKPSLAPWDKKLVCDSTSNCPRFEVLADWGNAAVLDKETGLVWEQSPITFSRKWSDALGDCIDKSIPGGSTNGRKGWRLPTIQELMSLVEPRGFSAINLPLGHPFSDDAGLGEYWSATTTDYDTSRAYVVMFTEFGLKFGEFKGTNALVWCVRGGQGVQYP